MPRLAARQRGRYPPLQTLDRMADWGHPGRLDQEPLLKVRGRSFLTRTLLAAGACLGHCIHRPHHRFRIAAIFWMNHTSACPTFVVNHAHLSDMGMRRSNNQDALAVMVTEDVAMWMKRGHLMMVADGMGAHAAGELASKLAVDNIPHMYLKLRDLYPPAALRQAIRSANATIHAKGQSSVGFQGMGTTCSCLVLLPQGALVAHIGDSRVYRLRGTLLEQLTFDHSLVWEMAAAGHMAEKDVPAYIPKNVITRSLGPHATVHVDLEGPYDALAGDKFLLCSDGLSGPLADEELGAILQCLPPDEAVQTLVDLANLRGGPDNISVIVTQIVGDAPTTDQSAAASDAAHADYSRNGSRRWQAASLLIASGASLGVLAYCLVNRFWTGVFVSSVALVTAFLAAWTGRSNHAANGPSAGSIGGPYGNGPYRKIECAPSRPTVDALAEIADKLRETTTRDNATWSIDWKPFDDERARAAEATQSRAYAAAIGHYSQAIRGVMRQLREHRRPGDSGSGVNLV